MGPNDRQQIGPTRYWRVVEGVAGELRVEPSGMPGLPLLMFVVFGLLAGLMWLVPEWELRTRIFCTIGMIVFGFTAQVAVAGQHAYELRQAPYLILDRDGCRLRGDLHVTFEQLQQFKIMARTDIEGSISTLVLCCQNGDELDVLSSLNGRDVVELKKALDRYVERCLN